MSNITGLPQAEASELRKLIDKLSRSLPEHIEMMALLAKADFEKFKALVAAGFTKEQAIDLLKAEKIKASV